MSKSPKSEESANIDIANSSTPSSSVLHPDIVSLIDFSLFSDMDIRNLAMTNKLLKKSADTEFNRRLGSYRTEVFIHHKNITKAYNSNPIVAKSLIESAGYATLVEIMYSVDYPDIPNIHNIYNIAFDKLPRLQAITRQEIIKRDEEIENYLTRNQLTDPFIAIEESLKTDNIPMAINLIGKYLFTMNPRYYTPEVENAWKPIQEFLTKRHDNNDTLLHLVARKDHPELAYGVARSIEKAWVTPGNCLKIRRQIFMAVNDEGDNPYHTAYKNNNYWSLLSLDYYTKSRFFDKPYRDPTLNQKNTSGQTTSECIELATQKYPHSTHMHCGVAWTVFCCNVL